MVEMVHELKQELAEGMSGLQEQMYDLREDTQAKHAENVRKLDAMEAKIKPLFPNGGPGLIKEMGDTMVAIRLDLAARSGAREEKKSLADYLGQLVVPIAVAGLMILAEHIWK